MSRGYHPGGCKERPRLAQPYLGLGGSLAAGWVVLLTGNLLLTRRMWRQAACIELEQM